MSTRCLCALLVAAALAVLSAPLRAADDPTGMWVGTTEVPKQGTDQVTLALVQVKGGHGGILIDSLGAVARETVKNVQYSNDGRLTFAFSLTSGEKMLVRLKVSGDAMTGEWVHPEGDAGAISLERR